MGRDYYKNRLIFHIDVNSAFLSWESVRRVKNGEQDLREIPAIIGGNPEKRSGIVLAKSIPAKQFSINTGEPVSMAIRKCPTLVVAEPDFELYVKNSRAFKKICDGYTPSMESFSIDEVFLDMSGMKNIYPDPIKTAYEIKDRIKNELGFTVNVGVGENKLLAKMASDFEKPDKVHTLFLDELEEKMWPLPIGDLFTCGKSSAEHFKHFGIKTIGDLANSSEEYIKSITGEKSGGHLWRFANGIDESEVTPFRDEAKGYSSDITVEDDIVSFEDADRFLLAQSDIIASRMRAEGGKCRCVCVNYRNLDFVNKSHQAKLPDPTDITQVIYETARKLLRESWSGEPLRLIGVSITGVEHGGFEQLSFLNDEKRKKQKRLDLALDSIRNRFGNDGVKRASVASIDRGVGKKHKALKNGDKNSEM